MVVILFLALQADLDRSLGLALQQGQLDRATAVVESLLVSGVEPSVVARSIHTHMPARLLPDLVAVLARSRMPRGQELAAVVSCLFGEWTTVDSLVALSERRWLPSTWETLASTAQAWGRLGTAAVAWEALARSDSPVAAQARLSLAQVWLAMGKIDEAADLAQSLMGAPAHRPSALLVRAKAQVAKGQDQEAKSLLESVSGPERSEASLWLGVLALFQTPTDSVAALVETRAAQRPDLPEANEALELALLVRHLPPDPLVRARVVEGARLEWARAYERAARAYGVAREGLGGDAAVMVGARQARCWTMAGNAEAACQVWCSLPDSSTLGARVLLGRAQSLEGMGLGDSAKATYLLLLERFPSSPWAVLARERLLE